MLQTQTLSSGLWEVLEILMNRVDLSNFYLVGGTALALQLGHRISVDIDMFGAQKLEHIDFDVILDGYEFQEIRKSPSIYIINLNGIKVDFVNYPYQYLEKPIIEGNWRLASLPDIGAMKLNAISGRGSRKDFVDLYFLLDLFLLPQLINFYKIKYPKGSEFLLLKSLVYFVDAEQEPMPKMLVEISWEMIKLKIQNEVRKLILK